MAGLEQYHAKRDFRLTGEPRGEKGRSRGKTGGGIFVVQKHDATRLHYDFRLEHAGVLWSWAVTRGPSLDPSDKRLAVHVEDHPLDYAGFEGVIPAGQYGAGAVIVWDQGTWLPEHDPAAMMEKGHIDFELKGDKLNGRWHLVRLRPRRGEKRDNWLLIKSDDTFADRRTDILEDAPQSVKSGLTVEAMAQQPDARKWQSNRGAGDKRRKPRAATLQATPTKASKARRSASSAKLPGFIEPCLARLETTPPAGDGWLHEVKFDGYRLGAYVADGEVKLYTRTGLDWTHRFGSEIASALAALDAASAILDGEIVVLGENGATTFSELQLALSENRTDKMIFYAFDLLWLDGEDLRGEPLTDRKEKLRDLLAGFDEQGPLRFSEHFEEPGKIMLEHACRMGLEGVVSKRADAPYRSGRGYDWVKSKCTLRQEFVIVGYEPSDKAGRGIRSLVLGYHDKGELRPVGRVGTGFAGSVMADLHRKLKRLERKTSAFSGAAAREKRVVWVKPELVAEIEFRSWTRDGNIRQASFQGLREDKPAEEIVMEKPEKPEARKAGRATRAQAAPARALPGKAAMPVTTSVKLSRPEKELWPDEHVSKQNLLDHYALAWPRMAQFVIDRPLALVRAPDGIHGQRFFQKHSMPGMLSSILKTNDPEDNEEILYIRDFDGLAALVQLGVVEVHIWGSKVEAIEKPDQFVFDLDPDEGLDIEDVRKAALEFKERLDDLELANFVKVSGGKGYHVVVPLKPKADWATVKTFAHDFAQAMEQQAPDRYTATLSKKARKGKIFIDYLRNGKGSTTVAPYSSRAKKGATVSMPVTWEMVADGIRPDDYAIGTKDTAALLKEAGPWADFFARGKPLDRR